MAKQQLTVCYLTRKENAVSGLANILKKSFPKVVVAGAASIDEACSIKNVDIIIADQDFKQASKGLPMIRVVSEDFALEHADLGEDFVTEPELNSFALIRAVKQALEKDHMARVLKEATIKDEATGLFNQHYLIETLSKEVRKAIRYGYPLSVLYMGLDGIKKANAKYGPSLADQAIVDFGLILSNSLRCVDIIGRFAGDEFMAILPETPLSNALRASERIHLATRKFSTAGAEGEFTLSVGIGLAELNTEFRTGDDILKCARLALAGAKKRGAGSCCTYEDARLIDEPARENRELIAGIQTQICTLNEEARRNHLSGVMRLLSTIQPYKSLISHHEHVAFYSERLAIKLGLSPEEVTLIKNSALLHDIGKIAIDERIVMKSGVLSSTEYAIIKQHPIFAAQMLSGSLFLKNEANIVLHHHEHYDGNGYPDHMNGTQIPLSSRIIALAEAWDTMIANQAYRGPLPLDAALQELKKQAGHQFDPELVAVFTNLIEG